jgi:molecular chaperone GrpE (heat shock protein)
MPWPDADGSGEPGRDERSDVPAGLAEAVRSAVHDEFDQVLHYVVDALRRNNAFDELSDRLRAAERRLEARRERPLVVAVYRLLDHLRHLDFDPEVKEVLAAEIVEMLTAAGFEETGRVGEAYNPALHEAIDGRSNGGRATVSRVDTRGLCSFGDVVFRAKVHISPIER